MASVPTAPRATDGLGNALNGYSAGDHRGSRRRHPERDEDHALVVRRGDRGCPRSWLSATNSRHSSWFVPLMIGTRLNLPVAKAVPSDSGKTSLLMFGVYPAASSLARMVETGRAAQARRGLAGASCVGGECLAGRFGARPRRLRGGCRSHSQTIAFSNNPLACGDATCDSVDRPPADSPKIVTLRGSPPKPAMLRFTQRSAACWSMRP